MIRVIRRCSTAALFFALLLGSSDRILAQPPTPVPAEADQAKSLKLVREIFADDQATAKLPVQKTKLALKVLRQARDSRKGSADQYVLLRIARDVVISAGDPTTTSTAIEQIAALFKVERVALYVAAAQKLQTRISTLDQRKTLGKAAAQWADKALTEDDFEAARSLVDTALAMARKTREAELARQLIVRRKEITVTKAALEQLRESPNNAAAKLTAGRYYCFVKNDWAVGIPLLAASGDSELGQLGRKEFAADKSDQDVLTLADGWWALAQQEDGKAKMSALSRAKLWYEKALPKQQGLERIRIEKRLALIAKTLADDQRKVAAGDAKKEKKDLQYQLRLSGAGQYLRTSLVWDGRPFTVEAIVTPAVATKGKYQSLIVDCETAGFDLMISADGFFEFKVKQNGRKKYVKARSIAGAAPGKETHVAGVFDGSHVGIFVNGVLQTTRNFSATRGPRLSKRQILIGADPAKTAGSATGFSNGNFESVMITAGIKYRRNFTPNRDLSQGVPKNLVVLHLDFRTGQEDGLKDKARRRNKITAVGPPTFVEVKTEKPKGDE
jgi:hypothetical protein